MMKQNASLDASFWINSCIGKTISFLPEYFQLFANSVVADEICYPIQVLGIDSYTAVLFTQWIQENKITLQEPNQAVDWFQQGENSAIALAIEKDCFLLIDDANPYHRAKSVGLKVIGSSEFAILLYDHGKLTFEQAYFAITQNHASKKQKRLALVTLEKLNRLKES